MNPDGRHVWWCAVPGFSLGVSITWTFYGEKDREFGPHFVFGVKRLSDGLMVTGSGAKTLESSIYLAEHHHETWCEADARHKLMQERAERRRYTQATEDDIPF